MKRYFKIMLAAATMSAAACSTIEEPPCPDQGKELTISVSTEEPTRAMITDSILPTGSEIGIGLFNPDGTQYMNKNWYHIYCISSDNEGGQVWTLQSNPLLGESEAYLYAYYPYSRYSSDVRNIYVNITSTAQDDFMYAGPIKGLNADNHHAEIKLKHALGAIRLSIRKGNWDGPGEIKSIGVGGDASATSGYFDATQGKFTSVSIVGTIYPTKAFQLSDEPNVQDVLLIPTGQPGNLMVTMNVDGVTYETTVPNFLLEAGKITQVDIAVDKGRLVVRDLTVQNWYTSDRGSASAPADYNVIVTGKQEGISIGTVIGTNGSVTITAVPYISKDAKVNPVTFEGEATFSQQMNEDTGVRTILIEDLNTAVTVTFNGYTL